MLLSMESNGTAFSVRLGLKRSHTGACPDVTVSYHLVPPEAWLAISTHVVSRAAGSVDLLYALRLAHEGVCAGVESSFQLGSSDELSVSKVVRVESACEHKGRMLSTMTEEVPRARACRRSTRGNYQKASDPC